MTNNKTTYRRLGDYIREVSIRNVDLSVTALMGINIDKCFMPSVANVIGTDLSTYKVVANGQFACNLMHVGRDEKIPVALNKGDAIIVSPAYFVFEIANDEILPEYLDLALRRPEFDRNAWFHTDGDVRGGMDKKGMMDLTIPVPSLEEQQRIVNRYKVIENRIANNKQTIAKLEEAAQALYRKMFVDGIDVENLPEGWRMGSVGELFELQRGFDLPSQNRIDGKYPICASTGISQFHNEYKVKAPGVVTGRSGSIGEVFYMTEDFWPLNTTLWVKDFKISSPYFVFYKLKELDLAKTIGGFAAVPTLNRNDVHFMESVIPSSDSMMEFQEKVNAIHSLCDNYKKEMEKLIEIQSLLMVGMGR